MDEVKHRIENAEERFDYITRVAWGKFTDTVQPYLDKFLGAESVASKEYDRIEIPALAERDKTIMAAEEKYRKTRQPAVEKYFNDKQPAFVEWQRVKAIAMEKYIEIQREAYAEYQKVIMENRRGNKNG